MFSFGQAGFPVRQAIFGYGCHICTGTCYDTCFGSCGWLSGGGCGFMSCDVGTHTTYYAMAQVQPGEPVEQLAELRKRLETALAGVQAQEQTLRERRSAEGGK
jgi:hypothetical protein